MKMQTRVRLGVSAILFVLLPRGCGALQLQSPAQHKTASTAGTHASAAPTDTTLINPGKSVGALRLGDTRERVLEIFPFKLHMDEEYSYKDPCPITEIHWLDREVDADGVFVYLENGRVFQIEAATPRYRTAEGITIHSSPTKVQWHYAHLRAYVLRNSGADIVGGRDLIYWVERQQGIAFETVLRSCGTKATRSRGYCVSAGHRVPAGRMLAPSTGMARARTLFIGAAEHHDKTPT